MDPVLLLYLFLGHFPGGCLGESEQRGLTRGVKREWQGRVVRRDAADEHNATAATAAATAHVRSNQLIRYDRMR